ncbi:ABC transporter permease [Infirmifilum sp. NZ]|uniref:ABC transporter permease n=1 Tax=Infirmifilum sp. NZ TaxID=2926850 RepID=UPI0027AAB1AB|nr:ABC transporter permease [Infirmifilum sp. NZ]UNQ73550.1 ABC transporter permease [Infirmifilum sp. NZ]
MPLQQLLEQTVAFVELELRRLRHDPTEVFTRAVQPVLWLTVFGITMEKLRAIPAGSVNYITYISPGVVLQSASFIALAYGIMLVWERESGILKKLVASPVDRLIIVLGRSMAGAVRALTQLFIVLAVALLIGARLSLDPLNVFFATVVLVVGCAGLTSLSIILAVFMKTRERFMGILQAISMPLFFTSNALYPVDIMPAPIKAIAQVNPLTYIISSLRDALVFGDIMSGLTGLLVTLVFTTIMVALATAFLQKIVE